MKKHSGFLLLTISFIITGSVFFGCKKGPDDPFFSFRSRKARVVGDYNVLSRTENYTAVATSGQQSKINTIINGASFASDTTLIGVPSRLTGKDSVIKVPAPGVTGTVVQFTMNFDENGPLTGVYEYQIKHDVKSPEGVDSAWTKTTIRNTKYEFRGSWDFLEGIDNYNTNERITLIYEDLLITTTITVSKKYDDPTYTPPSGYPTKTKTVVENKYANGENSEVLRIRELRATKMVFEQDISNYYIQNEANTVSKTGHLIETLEEKQ